MADALSMARVENKVLIVTGAASGLGAADARLLAGHGARVVMTDINEAAGRALAHEIGADFVRQDVTDEDGWRDLIAEVVRLHGRLDGVVNNAGIAPIANIETTSTEVWRKTLAVHLDATFFGCRYAIAAMKTTGGGSIVNMSSTAALIGLGEYLAYSAAKGAIRSLTKSVAIHCRAHKYGIRCNSVHPGSISTPMLHAALESHMGLRLMAQPDPEATRRKLGIGEPNDVAYLVLYLLSDESKHVTGAELVVDNGETVS